MCIDPCGLRALPLEAPTDPYMLALERTVHQITGSLRACKLTERYAREPVDIVGQGDGASRISLDARLAHLGRPPPSIGFRERTFDTQ